MPYQFIALILLRVPIPCFFAATAYVVPLGTDQPVLA
jgi:hypothetical protein